MNSPHTGLVAAPNFRLYNQWLTRTGNSAADWPMIGRVEDLKGWLGKIVVLNGGPADPHIRNLLRHPSRSPLVDWVTI